MKRTLLDVCLRSVQRAVAAHLRWRERVDIRLQRLEVNLADLREELAEMRRSQRRPPEHP